MRLGFKISELEDLNQEKLRSLIKERAQRVLQSFTQEAVFGVNDPELLEVLNFVCDYWKDNFRPAFASLCCEAVGGRKEAADEVGLMITLISAGGGIHDDIIDKSANKHFRMTVLGRYGLDAALLVGDLLIQKGWRLARNIVGKVQSEKLAEIIDVFGCWTLDVCEAEFMETQCRQNLGTDRAHYENILRKSMADIEACARLGAIMGGGSKREIRKLAEFGSQLGFIYRLTDDLKDTFSIEYNLPERLRNESVPLPILYAATELKETRYVIENIIAKSSPEIMDFERLLEACIQTEALDYVYERAKDTAGEALKNIEHLRDSMPKRILAFMINEALEEISGLLERGISDCKNY